LLADAIAPMTRAISKTCRVGRALVSLRATGLDAAPVVARGRVIGRIDRPTLESAARHGLGEMTVGRVTSQARLQRIALTTPLRRMMTGSRRVAGLVLAVDAQGRVKGFTTAARLAALTGRPVSSPPRACSPRLIRAALAPPLWQALTTALEETAHAGLSLLVVGGTVRDALAGRTTQDLDLVVCGTLDPWIATLAARLEASLERSPRFLTASMRLKTGERVDIGQARTETYSSPAALPEVRPASLEEDLARRDFTINAMAVHWTSGDRADLYDPLEGRDDLRRGELRVLHGLSFVEDPTRAWRAVELAARLGLRLSAETVRRMALAHEVHAFAPVSGARVLHELERTFSGDQTARAVMLAARHGLLATLLPGWSLDSTTRQRVRAACSARRGVVPRWLVVLAALASGRSARSRRALIARLEPPRRIVRLLTETPTSMAQLERAFARMRVPQDEWIWRTCRPHHHEILDVCRVLAKPRRLREAIDRYLTTLATTRADIGAADLTAAGVPVGPQLARGLERAIMAKLSGHASTQQEQLAVALASIRRRA
jgi:tRNA nucleotidyltransferase (CCA-adding enzyme)